ncbi:PP2C family protein-serine/threonine phosphatase [Microvirga sp. M2]|uniref:PP2C family protein-serine/threonine phosphatase n=1 Tax=Microvirga sp. M2 TaxID=3073270 RepID=UPI0039C49EA7
MAEDQLQKRVQRFILDARAARSSNSVGGHAIGTGIGAVRRENQDRALIVQAVYQGMPERNFTMGVVCDGIGGMSHGEDAAVTAISVFVSRVLRSPGLGPESRLFHAVEAANDAVFSQLRGRGGSTIAAAFFDDNGRITTVNVGDSRVYALMQTGALQRLTRDDTLAEFLRNSGKEAGHHANSLVQFVGMGEGIEPHVRSLYDIGVFQRLLVSSDGIHSAPEEVFGSVLRSAETSSEVIRRLLLLSEIMGGRDNASAVVFDVPAKPNRYEAQQGLNVTLVSSFSQLEVWIPILAEGQSRNERLTASLTEAATPDQRPGKAAQEGRSTPGRPRSNKRRRPAANVAEQESELPLDDQTQPELNVEFPNKQEE